MTRERTFRIAVRRFAPFESAIRKQWDAFESERRTGLQLEAQPFDLEELTTTLFAEKGLVRGDWDLAFINTDWVASAYTSHSVLDLAPFLKHNPPEGYPDAWTPSLLRLQNINAFMAGFPYHDGPECLIFRKDLFEDPREQSVYQERFGIPLCPPRTWREFYQMARFFQRPESGLYGTVFAAYPDGHNTVYDFLLQLWTRGGELFDRQGNIQLNTEAAYEALTFYRTILQDSTAVHPRCREMDSVQSGLAFAAGEVAMMVNWFGFAAMSETLAQSKVKGCVDIAQIPCKQPGSSTSLNIYWLLSIAAGSPHADLAYQFMRYCASAKMDKLLTLEGAIGCRKSTWGDADVNGMVPFYSRLLSLHENARELPQLSNWPQIAKQIDEIVLEATQTNQPLGSILQHAQFEGIRSS